MAQDSKIEWTHHTFNPWIGCHKVSAECKFCYAEADQGNRRKRVKWGINGTRSITAYSYWRTALAWDKEAKESGERKKVFCASLADVFEEWPGQLIDSKQRKLWWNEEFYGEKYCDVDGIPTFSHLTDEYIAKNISDVDKWVPLTLNIVRKFLWRLISMTPNLDWLLLTKRPENILKMMPAAEFTQKNIYLGTSVGCNDTLWRIEELKKCRHLAKVLFLSCEPLLEEISVISNLPGIDWVITGGESGHNKRDFNPDWARTLRDECQQANVAFFFKQIDKVYEKTHGIPVDLQIRQFPDNHIIQHV